MFEILIDFIEVIFGIGLFVNALLLVPQIIKLLREKHANDISLITFAGFVGVNIFTVLHGLIVHDFWLIVGYSFSVITSTIVTLLIIKYRFMKKIIFRENKMNQNSKKEPILEYLESIYEFIPASFYWYGLDSRFMNLNERTVKAVGAKKNLMLLGKQYMSYTKIKRLLQKFKGTLMKLSEQENQH